MDGTHRGPRFTQDWFPRLDAAAAYAMVRRARPSRLVEIGAGHSTRFMAQAVADGGLATQIVCIDPRPRIAIEGKGDGPCPEIAQQLEGHVPWREMN